MKFSVSSAAFERLAKAAAERGMSTHDYARLLVLAGLETGLAEHVTERCAWAVWAVLVATGAMPSEEAGRFVAANLEGPG